MITPIEKYWHGTEYNDCERLNIEIQRVSDASQFARCVVVHLLTKEENMGNHNLYMDVINERNERLNNSLLKGQNNNIALQTRIDKPPNEFGCNFAMFTQDTINAWVGEVPGITGQIPSDRVNGFSTRWGGPIVGNQDYGHISYYVIWQIRTDIPPIPPPPTSQYEKGLEDGVDLARRAMIEALSELP